MVTADINDLHQVDIALFSDIAVCGGDGTMRSVLVEVMRRSPSSTVLPIPLGTANDFAREWGWKRPGSIHEIEQRVLSAAAFPLGSTMVWKVASCEKHQQDIHFINYFSLGVDAAIVADFDSWRTERGATRQPSVLRNRLQYAVTSLKYWKYHLPPVTLSTGTAAFTRDRLASVFFANTNSVLGLGSVGGGTCASDRLLTAFVLGHPTAFLGFLPALGWLRWAREGLGRADRWELSCSSSGPHPAQADGESIELTFSQPLVISRAGRIQIRSGLPTN
jgi:diacylglycerol kinase family enzyme